MRRVAISIRPKVWHISILNQKAVKIVAHYFSRKKLSFPNKNAWKYLEFMKNNKIKSFCSNHQGSHLVVLIGCVRICLLKISWLKWLLWKRDVNIYNYIHNTYLSDFGYIGRPEVQTGDAWRWETRLYATVA